MLQCVGSTLVLGYLAHSIAALGENARDESADDGVKSASLVEM